jgi:malyl-CoA/(S)-citramalyl-CoA lyase
MRNPRDFFKPLALDAPAPVQDIPFLPSRMIHFLDFSNEKMVAKVPQIAPTVDILLGNLEDAVPVDRKEAARAGSSRSARRPTWATRSCGRASTRSSRRGCSTT